MSEKIQGFNLTINGVTYTAEDIISLKDANLELILKIQAYRKGSINRVKDYQIARLKAELRELAEALGEMAELEDEPPLDACPGGWLIHCSLCEMCWSHGLKDCAKKGIGGVNS